MSEYWIKKMAEARAIQDSKETTDWVKASDRMKIARNVSISILAIAALASMFESTQRR